MEEFIVSARKYRPLNFDAVVGQRALTTTLKNAIATGKLAHAYLFCGPRGVGKTTCARIFAKAINCLNPQSDGDPCGECESCRAFNEQRSMNIHELDAASNNSVEDIRELIQQVQIPPQIGRYKVFIIDEVHMLSSAAFNAFLKTLEEPPSYVIFILATTEKHKILPTILSRCQVYDFQRMTIQDTIEHLKYVAEKEGYTTEPEALNLIAQKADGGMRDALSIFDQMVSFTGGQLTYERVCQSLNVLSTEYYFRLVEHFLKNEVEPCLLLLNEVLMKGFDSGNFIGGLASHLRDVLVSRDAQTLPLLEMSEQMRNRYHEQALRCQPRFLYRALKLCNDCDQAYRTSRNKRLQVEICLIQLAQLTEDEAADGGPGPAKTIKPVFQKRTSQEPAQQQVAQRPSQEPTPQTQAKVQPASPTQPQATPQPAAAQTPAPEHKSILGQSAQEKPAQLRRVTLAAFGGKKKANQEAEEAQAQPAQKHDKPLQENDLHTCWYEIIGRMPKEETAMAMRMRDIRPTLLDDHTIGVTVYNDQVAADMRRLVPRMESYIRQRLLNDDARIVVSVAEAEKVQRKYSKPERLRLMMEKNHAVARLVQGMNLRIE